MNQEVKLSVNAYAKSIGVSKTAVQKAIAAGKLVKGFDKNEKKIIPSVANAEYSFTKAATKLPKLIKKEKQVVAKLPTKGAPKPKAGKSKALPNETGHVEIPEVTGVAIISSTGENVIIELCPDDSINEATRKKILIEAAIKKLELDEKQKILIKQSDVDKAGFALAIQIKKALYNVPSRIIALVRAAPSPVQAENIFRAEINSVLEILSKLKTVDTDAEN